MRKPQPGQEAGRVRRIGVCAPGVGVTPEIADRTQALAERLFAGRAELVFHPQCFLAEGHFAGPDAARAGVFVDLANDPRLDAVWFARGGYGAVRIAADVLPRLGPAAGGKTYLGYSDAGCLLGALHRARIGRPVHGPMPVDLIREGGEAAVARALTFLVEDDAGGLEPSLGDGRPAVAFNLIVLSQVMGTVCEPLLAGRVLMLEEVSEHLYRIDRSLAHILGQPAAAGLAGLRLGRCSMIPENDRPFGAGPEEMARFWCARAGVSFLGAADIGHDADNRIIPFG